MESIERVGGETLERSHLSSYMHLLLFRRIQVWFLAPRQPITTVCNIVLGNESSLLAFPSKQVENKWYSDRPVEKACIHTIKINKNLKQNKQNKTSQTLGFSVPHGFIFRNLSMAFQGILMQKLGETLWLPSDGTRTKYCLRWSFQ